MTLHSFVDRLAQLFSWLYYRHQWEEWQFLAVGIAVLIPLLLIAVRQRKERAGKIYSHHNHERSPIIGVKLAHGRRNPPETADPKKVRSHSAARGGNKPDDATKQADKSSEQIRQLQHEIARRQQAEACLERQLAELTAANEKLRHEIDEARRAEEHHQKQTVRLPGANKELQEGHSGPKPAEESTQDQVDSALAVDRHPTDSRRTDEPLDVEKLKAIAALARQIQQRPRAQLG